MNASFGIASFDLGPNSSKQTRKAGTKTSDMLKCIEFLLQPAPFNML